MRNAPVLGLVMFSLMGVFLPTLAHADIAQQLIATTTVTESSDTNVTFYLGTTTQAYSLRQLSFYLSDPSGIADLTTVRITCLANTWSSSQSGCTETSAINSTQTYNIGAFQRYDFPFSATTTLQSSKVWVVEIIGAPAGIKVWGMDALQFAGQCTFLGGTPDCTGTPYWAMNASPNWDLIQFPLVFSTTSQAIMASSSLWQNLAMASTTAHCESDNYISAALCGTFTYIFMPNPAIFEAVGKLPSELMIRAPFTYVDSFSDTIDTLYSTATGQATSTSGVWHYENGPASSSLTLIDPDSTLAKMPLVTTLRDYLGYAIYLAFAGYAFITIMAML